MKGKQGILSALALGVVIILGAFYASKNIDANGNGALVALAPERSAIETRDTDGDGTEDWQEDLEGRVFETIPTPTSTISSDEDVSYTPPETFTGRFSEAFFQDYLEGKIEGQDYTDPAAFVGSAVEAIEKNTQPKRHTQFEFTTIPDSPEALRTYGTVLAEMLKKNAIQNENEIVILEKALSSNEPKVLDELKPIEGVYAVSVEDMLKIKVPQSFAQAHLDLLNAFEIMLLDVQAMQLAFEDPLYALARAKGYQEDTTILFNAFKGIGLILKAKGITYSNDELGAFFSIFTSI